MALVAIAKQIFTVSMAKQTEKVFEIPNCWYSYYGNKKRHVVKLLNDCSKNSRDVEMLVASTWTILDFGGVTLILTTERNKKSIELKIQSFINVERYGYKH